MVSSVKREEVIDTPPETGPDDPSRVAEILFTTGTSTGKPKGCPVTVSNLVHGHATYIHSRGVDSTTRNVLHSANFRAGASGYIFACGGGGGTLILPGETFSTAGVLDAIKHQKANYLWCMPAQMFALTQDPTFEERKKAGKLDKLGLMFISGDTVTRSILNRACEAFAHTRVLTGHGMTEGVGNLGWWEKSASNSIRGFGEILTLGQVLPGAKVKICDGEDRQVVNRGRTGELHIGGPKMISGYLGGLQSESFYDDEDGNWVITGDRAMMDQDGFVYIVGRSKDIIMRIGVPIPPTVIESCFTKFGINQAQVVGLPDPKLRENPVAILSSLKGRTEGELKDAVVDLLGADYSVGHILTLDQLRMKEWPLYPSGKFMKHKLREEAIRYFEDRGEI